MSVNVGNEKAIITIEVELVSSVTGDPTILPEERPDFFGEETVKSEEIEKIENQIEDLQNQLDSQQFPSEEIKNIENQIGDLQGQLDTQKVITEEQEKIEAKMEDLQNQLDTKKIVPEGQKEIENKIEDLQNQLDTQKDLEKRREVPKEEGMERDEILDVIAEEVNTSIKESIDDALEEEGVDFEGIRNASVLVKDIDSRGISNVKNLAKNPESFMESTFMRALSRAGPHGALVAAIISAIAGSPALVTVVVQALGVKGAPLNQDFAWTEDEQYNQQFDRVVQFRRLTGDDPVITVLTKGFVVGDPDFIDNSLVDTNIARTARVNLRDSSLGYIHGI